MNFRMFLTLLTALALSSALLIADETSDPNDGTWLPTEAELAGKKLPEGLVKSIVLVVKDDQYKVTVGEKTDQGTLKRDTKAKPMRLDIIGTDGPNKGKTILAIYELKGDTLKVCYDLSGKTRPTTFETKPDTPLYLVTYKREKK